MKRFNPILNNTRSCLTRTCERHEEAAKLDNKELVCIFIKALEGKKLSVYENSAFCAFYSSKPFSPMESKTLNDPKVDKLTKPQYDQRGRVVGIENTRLNKRLNAFYYKGNKYLLNAEEYLLAEYIYQFMFQHGEPSC